MLNTHRYLLLTSFVILLSCNSQLPKHRTDQPSPVETNKALVHTFYREVIGQQNKELADQLVTEDYIQHNPMVKTGKEGLMETLAFLKQMPRPDNPVNPIVRTIAEGDYVALHLSVNLGGIQRVVIDLFRLEDGRLAEHWDAIEDHPDTTLNGRSMTDGAVQMEVGVFSEDNRMFVLNYYQSVWIDGDPNKLSRYIAEDLIQHAPEIRDGLEGLQDYLIAGVLSIEKVHRIIGESNFAVIQLEGKMGKSPVVLYDILRLQDGQIKEQWRVKQIVPDKMAHQNGMI